MKRTTWVYLIKYASGLFRENCMENQTIWSNKKLKKGQMIVIEHRNRGVFIGEVIEDITKTDFENISEEDIRNDCYYRYIQDIDLSNYFKELEREKRKQELKEKMKEEFKKIDEKKKFEYYASIDDNFKVLYEEFKKLGE